MIEITIIATIIAMAFVLLRALLGPTVFDRVLAGNCFGTHIIVLIVLIGEYTGTELYIDIAITYALINFIAVVGLLRFFKYNGVGE
jgi:multicomponent Na+:H+ antiporter subunit F